MSADLHAVVVDEIRRREGLIVDDRHTRELVAALREMVAWHEPWDVDRDDWRCNTCRERSGTAAMSPCGPLKAIAEALGIEVSDGG